MIHHAAFVLKGIALFFAMIAALIGASLVMEWLRSMALRSHISRLSLGLRTLFERMGVTK